MFSATSDAWYGAIGVGERDAPVVVVLLDGCGQQPPDPNAVAPHDDGAAFTVSVREIGAEGLAVARAQLEDVPHFDATPGRQLAVAARAGVAILGKGDVGHHIGLEVSGVVGVPQVVVTSVSPDDEVRPEMDRVVDNGPDAQETDG